MRSVIGLCLILTACGSNSSPQMQTALEPYQTEKVTATTKKVDVTPKVDILFVIDNSLSMIRHQKNLSDNIGGFISAFERSALLDFHVAALPIYDSYHFDGVLSKLPIPPHYPLGQLLPLKNGVDPTTKGQVRFLTKATPNYLSILHETLLLGEQPGPAYEELFSPVLFLLSPQGQALAANAGFYRPDAYLILILITDSDDASPRLTAPQFWSRLLELKGGDRRKVTAVGVVSPSHRSCPKDQGAPQGPVQIEKLIALSDGLELDLCSHNFGQELARIGSDLSVRVSRIVIPLAGLPDFNPKQKFEVTYMDEPIERADALHPSRGWSYDPDTQSIIIEPKTELKETAEPRLAVNYTPILAGNATIGKVKNRKPAESK